MPKDDVCPLTMRLFGPLQVRVHGEPLPALRSRKGWSLLALLTLRHNRAIERAWLAGLLWPDSDEGRGLGSLRVALQDLRRALGPQASRVRAPSRRALLLDLEGADVDLLRFDAAVARGDPGSLKAAVALYRGPLLEGWTEEWVFEEQQPRATAYLQALERLASRASSVGDLAAAEQYLRRTVAAAPERESAQRALMETLARGDHFVSAMQIYREMRRRLRAFKVEPEAETAAAYHQIRAEARRRALGTASPPRPPFSTAFSDPGLSFPPREARMPVSRRISVAHRRSRVDAIRSDQRQAAPAATALTGTPGTVDGGPPGLVARARSGAASASVLADTGPGGASLPVPATPLIGRRSEVIDARRLLEHPDVRLVTLTGPAGVGKTRLALQTAAELSGSFADEVQFVSLASVREPGAVLSLIARALPLPERDDPWLADGVKEYLRTKQLLLVLDNFEQALAAAPVVAELLEAAPACKILVTSRAVLRLRGEHELVVPPLALPDPQCLPSLPVLSRYSAVQLFVQSAAAARRGFALTPENAGAVAAICHRLDGLPLALELAAAHAKLLAPASILARLEHRLTLLSGGARDLPARQRTLQAALAWSYNLLAEAGKSLFRRLCVFVSGFTLAAAAAVADPSGTGPALLDGIASLVEQSLVYPETDDERRFRMLETIREYGLERLEANGELLEVQERHAHQFLALAEQRDGEEADWLDRLEGEVENLRAALDWFIANGQVEPAFRMGRRLFRLWYLHGYWGEGRAALARLLALPGLPLPDQAVLLREAGQLAWLQSDYLAARSLLERSVALCRELGLTDCLPAALNALGEVARTQGDYAAARALFEESLSLLRTEGNGPNIAWAVEALGEAAYERGDEAAESLLRESLALFREHNDLRGVSHALCFLAEAARGRGGLEQARALQEESLAIRRRLRLNGRTGRSLESLGAIATSQGHAGEALTFLREALAQYQQSGDRRGVASTVERMAMAAAAGDGRAAQAGQLEWAARLFGAADSLRETLAAPRPSADYHDFEYHQEMIRAALTEESYRRAWIAGKALSYEQTAVFAQGGGHASGN